MFPCTVTHHPKSFALGKKALFVTLAFCVGVVQGCSSFTSQHQEKLKADNTAEESLTQGGTGQQSTAGEAVELSVSSKLSCPTLPEMVGGNTQLKVSNTSSLPVTIHVSDDANKLYQSLEKVGTAGARTWHLRLPNGHYHLQCVFDGKAAISGDSFSVRESKIEDSRPLTAVTKHDLAEAAQKLNHSEKPIISNWLHEDDRLLSTIQSGDRASARRAWQKAYLSFRSLADVAEEWPSPADTIGDFGTSTATHQSSTPPDIEGYHRIEWGLWHEEPMPQLADVAAKHNENVHAAAKHAEAFNLYPSDYGLRVHEVSEEIERNDLHNRTDFGAHVTASTVISSIASTRRVLAPIRQLLINRRFELAQLDKQLKNTEAIAQRSSRKYDGKQSFDNWQSSDKQELASAISKQNELLAPIATTTIVRRY